MRQGLNQNACDPSQNVGDGEKSDSKANLNVEILFILERRELSPPSGSTDTVYEDSVSPYNFQNLLTFQKLSNVTTVVWWLRSLSYYRSVAGSSPGAAEDCRCELYLSMLNTMFSRWWGVVPMRGKCQFKCRPHLLT
ncbi:hypothetical protein TNCV_3649441 [Trichonephila clavipes]|nr:hypothetical protein TNCV_3649441 [Trichonephila clavipes]